MRLFLLPISTRRTLIYCERVRETLAPGVKPPLSERVVSKANDTWVAWEKADKGWRKWVTDWGNGAFKRIPFEEWGLKSIPPATKKRIEEIDSGATKFQCLYPGAFLKSDRVSSVLEKLAKERQSLHWNKFLQCLFWMPISFPFTFVPVLPNLPFYYLCFRAWSHYRALYGGKLLEHLVSKNLIVTESSAKLDETYVAGLLHPSEKALRAAPTPTQEEIDQVQKIVRAQTRGDKEEVLLLRKWNGDLLAEAFHLPEMEVEIERGVEQVQKALEKERLNTENKEKEQTMSKKSQ